MPDDDHDAFMGELDKARADLADSMSGISRGIDGVDPRLISNIHACFEACAKAFDTLRRHLNPGA